MKLVKLTQGVYAKVDDSDFDRVNALSWYAAKMPAGNFYAYRTARPSHRTQLMHRFILEAPEDVKVDHINGDTLDNRRVNLRFCSHEENMRNRKTHINSLSGIKGVRRIGDSAKNPWCARISVSGKTYHLGLFPTKEAASDAYNAAAAKKHGEFARLNNSQDA